MHEFLHYRNEIGEPTKFGEALTIVGASYGRPVSNQALIDIAVGLGLPTPEIENAKKAIATTGFTNRYFSYLPGEGSNSETAVKRSVAIGATLLKEVIKSHGWKDGIDVFVDTSALLPTSVNKEILEMAGLPPDKIVSKSYRYACAGAVGAFIDCLSDPALKDARIVIAALEPLSMVIDNSQFLSPKTITIPAIFGDAHTLMAFTPNRFNLNVKEILIKPDHGVIRMNPLYDFEKTPSTPSKIPNHYRFAEGGKSIFHFSGEGAYLKIESPEPGKGISMDGMATGFFFGDQTTGVITDLLKEYGDPDLLKRLNGKNIVMHPASKPVVDRIAKLLWRGKLLDTPNLPFLMDAAGYSNGSSATTLNRWRYMIEHNMVDANLPTLWIAPGIGSAIAGAIGTIRP